MYKPTIGITPEGWPSIGICALSTLSFALLDWEFLSFVFLLLTLFSCHFFRDPERVVPADKDCAVSPADGKVINISEKPDPFTQEPCQCIAIFMNVFSVHVNRSPITATVEDIAYYPGTFVNASLDKAATDNERCAYSLTDTEQNSWSMVQISGLIARRIVCRTTRKATLGIGERFGMIKFGSRVDVYLPNTYSPAVMVGEKLFAGQSIIARKK